MHFYLLLRGGATSSNPTDLPILTEKDLDSNGFIKWTTQNGRLYQLFQADDIKESDPDPYTSEGIFYGYGQDISVLVYEVDPAAPSPVDVTPNYGFSISPFTEGVAAGKTLVSWIGETEGETYQALVNYDFSDVSLLYSGMIDPDENTADDEYMICLMVNNIPYQTYYST